MKRLIAVTAAMFVLGSAGLQAQTSQLAFAKGDVFIATCDGKVQWRSPSGTLIRILDTGVTTTNINTTLEMAFDACNNLYVTAFSDLNIYKFDNRGNLLGTFGPVFVPPSLPVGIVFDAAGNAYVGQAIPVIVTIPPPPSAPILKFDGSGNPAGQFFPTVPGVRGSMFVDLAADQCTMFYTAEGTNVSRFNVCTGQQLPDFSATALPGAAAFSMKIIPGGGVLVADLQVIVRLDASGNIIQLYDAPGEDAWLGVSLDPDGTSFWAADVATFDIFKFDLATGNVLLHYNAGANGRTGIGIAVNGEPTAARPPPVSTGATRTSKFWFTHVLTNAPNAVTLYRAFQASCGNQADLGFLILPTNGNGGLGAAQTAIEAMGLYYQGKNHTGESRTGIQDGQLRASPLCKARKELSGELIAAIANTQFLHTDPATNSYFNGITNTNFPSDLIAQAQAAAAGFDPIQITQMTMLLQKFNQSGVTNGYPAGLAEYPADKAGKLRKISLDPTTQLSCPGINTSCDTAETVLFPNANDPFAPAKFSRSINISGLPLQGIRALPPPTCGGRLGKGVMWKILPGIGATNRQFTVDTFGSNCDTVLQVWSGTGCSNIVAVSNGCSDNVFFPFEYQSQVQFTTDGNNTFYIQAVAVFGTTGRMKLHLTSP